MIRSSEITSHNVRMICRRARNAGAFAAIAMSAVRLVAGVESTPVSTDPAPSVLRAGNKVVLQSPSFSLTLDMADGLHAEQWENKLTGRKLVMGHGAEVGFDIGLPGQSLTTPQLTVTKAPPEGRTAGGEAVFELTSREPSSGTFRRRFLR